MQKTVRREDAARLIVLGNEHLVRLSGADTGGALALFEVTVPPDSGIPPHVHSREDEIFQVLEGSAELTIGGRRHDAPAGTTVLAPRDIPHTFRTGPQGARILVATYPAGIEHMFAELARLPAGPPDMARVAEICGRHGVSFV